MNKRKEKDTLQEINQKVKKFINSDKKSDKELKTILSWTVFGITAGLAGKALANR